MVLGQEYNFVTENTILSQGKQCFHRTHYLCHTKDGNCLPRDACPFEAIVTNLYITKVEKKGNCARVSGTYDILVWFKYAQGKLVGHAEAKEVTFTVHIPLTPVGSSVLQGNKARLCVEATKLKVLRVLVERDKKGICQDCCHRLKAEIEQEVLAFEYSLQPLFLPSCLVLKDTSKKTAEKDPVTEPLPEKHVSESKPDLKSSTQGTPRQEEKSPTSPAVIKGKVVNNSGQPLFRAKIKAFDGSKLYVTRTNLDGYYFLPLYPDNYELMIGKSGYIAQTLQLYLSSGEIRSIDFELKRDPARKGFRLKF